MEDIKIQELIELSKQGLSGKKIVEYFHKQGRSISATTVNRMLRRYYQSHQLERPKAVHQYRINIPIEEMVRLKEEEHLSDKKIAEYFSNRGQPVSQLTVLKRLKSYYQSQGRKKPIVTKKLDLPIEKMVELVEQGKTYKKIANQISTTNRSISGTTVNQRLKQYYRLQGRQVPLETKRIDINTKELVALKEQGLSDRQIAQIFTLHGKKISRSTVCTRLRTYYQSQGKEKPKVVTKIDSFISNEEVAIVKERGLSNIAVARYFTEQGRPISATAVGKKLQKYYQLLGIEKPQQANVVEFILLNGMTIREYIQLNDKKISEQRILNQFQRLRFVAEHVEKLEGKWMKDDGFLEVIDRIENPTFHDDSKKEYLPLGSQNMQKQNLTDLKNSIFHGNEDFMTYTLLREKAKPMDEFNNQIWQEMKGKYEEKVKNYLTQLHHLEEQSRKNLRYEDKKKEENHLLDGESR